MSLDLLLFSFSLSKEGEGKFWKNKTCRRSSCLSGVKLVGCFFLRIDEADHDVARSGRRLEAFVEVRQAARMHQHPALARVGHAAVVAQEATAAALHTHTHTHTIHPWSPRSNKIKDERSAPHLVVLAGVVHGDVDGEGGRVVVRLQIGLLRRLVAHHKVHDGLGRLMTVKDQR